MPAFHLGVFGMWKCCFSCYILKVHIETIQNLTNLTFIPSPKTDLSSLSKESEAQSEPGESSHSILPC